MSTIKYLTKQELKALFKAIEKDSSKYKERNEALIKISYYCALRISEAVNLEKEYYNKESSQIYCKRLKGSLNNTLRIVDKDVLRAFNRHYRNCGDSKYIFLSRLGTPLSRKTADLIFKKYCEIANIKDKSKWHFHVLKHTRAVELAEEGFDLKEIQYWLGHKEISNTQIYFEFTTAQQNHLYRKLEGR